MKNRVFILKNFIIVLLTALLLCLAFCVSSFALSAKSATGLVNSKDGAYIRKTASTTSSKVVLAKNNAKLTISRVVFTTKNKTTSKYKWYYVTCSGKKGYIRSDLVDNIKYSAVSGTTTGPVYYRGGAGIGMKSYGRLSKGKKLMIYLSARDYNTKLVWYLTKVGSSYRYVSSNYVKITGSILENPGGSGSSGSSGSGNSGSSGSGGNNQEGSGTDISKMTDSEYKSYLTKLGFPSSYTSKLLTLHKSHPNWIFTPDKIGIDFDTAVSRESRDGVSLIEDVHPIALRDKSSYSFKASTTYVCKTASTSSTKLCTLPNNAEVRILSEKYDPSKSKWYKVTTTVSGKIYTGYTKASITSQVYPKTVQGKLNDSDVNIRSGAGTGYSVVDSADKNDAVSIVLTAVDKDGDIWYKIKRNGGYAYIYAEFVTVSSSTKSTKSAIESQPADEDQSVDEDSESAATTATTETETSAKTATTETETKTATISSKSVATTGLDALYGTGKVNKSDGTYIPKDGSNWFNASKEAVAYYLDPRNFLNETRIFMFEDLSYNSAFHTTTVVTAVLNGTKLPDNGFTSRMFVNAGSKYDISPVHLAARARQETGGGSIAISGYKINGKKVYNPFNIGATSSSNPVMNGLNYAYSKGWTTQEKSVLGGAEFIAKGYISAGQNSPYLQKWNVSNGLSNLATHQYMTNIMAPYSEAASTKSSYSKYGILDKSLTFEIPVFNNMPTKTTLPS